MSTLVTEPNAGQQAAAPGVKPGSVAVLMTVYNGMPYLEEAVACIQRQTLKDWHLIIVDDGSTDGTAAWLDALDDPRIRVVHQANAGAPMASNHGLSLCHTDFVARFDADDVCDPRRLELQRDFLLAHPEVGLVGSQVAAMGPCRVGKSNHLPMDHDGIIRALTNGKHGMCHSAVMVRTALLKQVGGYWDRGRAEDYDMFFRIADHAQLANLPELLLSYRILDSGLHSSGMLETRLRIAYAVDAARRRREQLPAITYEAFCEEAGKQPLWRRALGGVKVYALAQYRKAQQEILGPRPLMGYARLGWAAICAPQLTAGQVWRAVRRRLPGRKSTPTPAAPLDHPVPAPHGMTRVTVPPAPAATGQITLFRCRIDPLQMPQAADRVYRMATLPYPECQYVVTPNVNHVVTLQRHEALRRAYDDASLVLADGMPLVAASRMLGKPLPARITGSDLVPALFDHAQARGGVTVFLLGALPGVAEVAARNIARRWPAVKVVGTYSPPLGFENDARENERILAMIADCRPEVLVVGLGAPKQELWVHKHREEIAAGVALCVGATIDFLAGNKRRAPKWMQRHGLEWVHRVATEPRRLAGRYLRDAFAFPRILWAEWRLR